jgi:hypothetical protein
MGSDSAFPMLTAAHLIFFSKTMNTSRFLRKNKSNLIWSVLILGSIALNYGQIRRNMQDLIQTREIIATNSQRQTLLEEQLKSEQSQARIAETRYKAGCTIVVSSRLPKNLVTLVEGETVLDRTTKKSLPEGTVVCDGVGNTGVLVSGTNGQPPVVKKLAYTGKRQLAIDQVRKIRGAKVYYFTPEK